MSANDEECKEDDTANARSLLLPPPQLPADPDHVFFAADAAAVADTAFSVDMMSRRLLAGDVAVAVAGGAAGAASAG